MRNEDNQEKASSHQPINPPADNNKPSGTWSWTSPAGSGFSLKTTIPAVESSLAASPRYQRIRDIQAMLKLGAYWVPAQKLAPILAKIFFTMRRAGHSNHPSR